MKGGGNMPKGTLNSNRNEEIINAPSMTPEVREKQMISLAVNEAERRIRNGTASSQIICNYLKLANKREDIEREKLELEKKLVEAKIEALQSSQRIEELYSNAITAMKSYQTTNSIIFEDDINEDSDDDY